MDRRSGHNNCGFCASRPTRSTSSALTHYTEMINIIPSLYYRLSWDLIQNRFPESMLISEWSIYPSGRNSQSIGSAIITHRFDPRFSLLSLFKCQAFTQHNTGSPNYSGPSIKVSFLHQQIYAVTISSFCSMDFRRWPLWPGALKDTYSSKHDTVYTRMLGSAKLDIRLITSLISYIPDI